MKKLVIAFIVALSTAFMSCGNGETTTTVDSVDTIEVVDTVNTIDIVDSVPTDSVL